jgi:hypothetical protein
MPRKPFTALSSVATFAVVVIEGLYKGQLRFVLAVRRTA